MEEVWNIMAGIFGAVMFVMGVTLLLYYVKEYEISYGILQESLIKDTVIISLE